MLSIVDGALIRSFSRDYHPDRKILTLPSSAGKRGVLLEGISMLNAGKRRVYPSILGFATAIAAVSAAFWLRNFMVLRLGVTRPNFFIFYPIVFLVAVLCGLWPGLLATAFAAVITDYWILSPVGSFKIPDTSNFIARAAFLAIGFFMSWIAERYRRLQKRIIVSEAEQALRKSVDRFNAVATATGDAVYRMNPDWTTMLQLNGRNFISDTNAPNDNWFQQYIPPEDQLLVQSTIGNAIRTRSKYDLEHRVLRVDGSLGWTHSSAHPLLDASGRIVEWIGIARDITEKKMSEDRLRLAASVFSHTSEGIMITGPNGTIIDVNDAFTHITGYSRDDALGQNPRFLKSGRQDREFYEKMWNKLAEEGRWSGEFWNRSKSGELCSVMQTISAVLDGNGDVQHYVSLFHDITLLKQHEWQLEQIAFYDSLTGLPNRVLLTDRLRQAMSQTHRRGQRLTVALLDLDGFKEVNDRHGHEAGDNLLIVVAGRMKHVLREGDTLARLGGDEFIVVLPDLGDASASVPLLTRLLSAAAEPVHIGESTVRLTASIGVTVFPQEVNLNSGQLLRQADHAMYQAKQAGRNRYQFFDPTQDHSDILHDESLKQIRDALEGREFELYYQPKVKMSTGKIVGAEALLRWNHGKRGLLPPATFLPLIEEHPLSAEIDDWVISSALSQMETWQAHGFNLPVSVNVGAMQLHKNNFVDQLRALLEVHPHIQPSSLELEVLESVALQNVSGTTKVLDACRKIGVSIALGDFGTSVSSLSYINHLPVNTLKVNTLKVNQRFASQNVKEPGPMALLEAVLRLANSLRRQVIVEGVETADHGVKLLEIGYELAQGYAIAHPMPAGDLKNWSSSWRPDPRWVN